MKFQSRAAWLVMMACAGLTTAAQTASPGAGGDSSAPNPALSRLPATFTGVLPCADCPGIRYQLDLYPDHKFTSRMTYEERHAKFDDSGHWKVSGNGTIVVLHGSGASTQKFSIPHADTLRRLDPNGNEINSKLNYDLKRAAEFTPIGNRKGTRSALENTDWKLMQLGEAPITADSLQREADFSLNPETHRVSGSDECNRLLGRYELNGRQLKFGQMAGTRMACPKGMNGGTSLMKALGQVTTWKIRGQILNLLDDDGKIVARFAAHPVQ